MARGLWPAPIGKLMRLTVNGENCDVPQGATIAMVLAQLGLSEAKLAVERNREIAPRSTWGTTVLDEGDALEIVHFVGGG